MCECLDYEDGTRHTCEACVDDLELMRAAMKASDAENEKLRRACEAVLLFYRAVYWDNAAADRWHELTGSREATTRVMCDTVRAALATKEVPNAF